MRKRKNRFLIKDILVGMLDRPSWFINLTNTNVAVKIWICWHNGRCSATGDGRLYQHVARTLWIQKNYSKVFQVPSTSFSFLLLYKVHPFALQVNFHRNNPPPLKKKVHIVFVRLFSDEMRLDYLCDRKVETKFLYKKIFKQKWLVVPFRVSLFFRFRS
jgi:hypothetical protein